MSIPFDTIKCATSPGSAFVVTNEFVMGIIGLTQTQIEEHLVHHGVGFYIFIYFIPSPFLFEFLTSIESRITFQIDNGS